MILGEVADRRFEEIDLNFDFKSRAGAIMT